MTTEEAKAIMDAHDIWTLLDNEEEVDLLRQQNPDLLEAYTALRDLAQS